jgi:hypothetical protein
MIEIKYKTPDAYSFWAFSLKELRAEITAARRSPTLSLPDAIALIETTMTQTKLASLLGVSSRYLRYIKTGKRLVSDATKKDKTIRNKILGYAQKAGGKVGGAYSSGQLRAANYLDFVCEKEGEINKDMHVVYFEHGAISINDINYEGFYNYLTENMRAALLEMCDDGSYCDDVTFYRRGNKHPKKDEFCKECGEKLIASDNKRLIYTVIMKK